MRLRVRRGVLCRGLRMLHVFHRGRDVSIRGVRELMAINDFDETEYLAEAATMDYLPRPEEIAERAREARSMDRDELLRQEAERIAASSYQFDSPSTNGDQRKRIIELAVGGKTFKDIAKIVGCHAKAVSRVVIKWEHATATKLKRHSYINYGAAK